MNFLDSYFKTGDKMRSKAARQEFYTAVIEFYYKGEEPQFKTEAAEVGWEGIAYSLRKARAGRMGGEANGKKGKNQPPSKGATKPEANREPNPNETPTKEEEGKPNGLLEEEDPLKPPEETGFALLCLKALDEELGRDYTSMPPECFRTVSSFEGRYGIGDVRAMVAMKRDEWRGTDMAMHLTPNTLFSRAHFEQYMGQLAEKRQEAGAYADYD